MAKQVNKPFLITLTLVLIAAIGGAFFGIRYIRAHPHGDPKKLMTEGNQLLADNRPMDAAGKFGQAAFFSPNDPLPITRYGDALYEMGKTEPENLPKAMAQWNAALQINPNFLPALKSKLNAYIDDMEAYQRPTNFVQVRDTAARVAKIDPTDSRAVSYQYIATLSAWMNRQQTDPSKIKEAMDGLRSLAKADPTDANMPYQVARGLIQQGQDEMQVQHDMTAAMSHYNEAAKLMDDAVRAQPGNVMMLLRAGQIYAILDIIIQQPSLKGDFNRQSGLYLDRARSLVRDDDKNYAEVQTVFASRKLQSGDRAEAERVYRNLLMKRPDDVPVRLVLAEILQADRTTRKEAADLLAKTVADGEKPGSSKTALARAYYLRAILRLAAVRMDLLEDINDPSERNTMLATIEADIAKAESKMPENPESLKVRGRLYLIKGEVQKAVTALTKAVQLMDAVSAQRDYELLYTLARAELAAQQNEAAKRLLQQVVKAFPTYAPARSLLVDILLNSNDVAEASNNIDELEKQMPGSPIVARFRILTLDPKKDKATIDRLFMLLPQDSIGQMVEKARIAIIIDRIDDAIKLMEAARGLDPKNVRLSDKLARLYIYKGERDRALKIINEALVVEPKDPQLTILRDRLNNVSTAELFKRTEDLIEASISDPLSRALQMALLERLRGNAKGLYDNLIAAEKIAPQDPRVQEQLFEYYLATKQWDAAAKYIDPLTKANYGGSGGLIYRWKLASTRGDLQSAVSIGREFTQKMPEFATSWIVLGQSLSFTGQYEEALRCFKTARDLQSSNRDAIKAAVDCLYALNRPTEARPIITEARRLYPTDLGLAEMELEWELKYGDPKKALDPLKANVQKEPNQVVHYLNLAQAYYRMSTLAGTPAEQTANLSQGMETLKAAISLFPDEIQPYINLAEMQSIAKDRASAEATLKQMCAQPKLKDLPEPKYVLAEFYIKGDQSKLAEQPLRDAVAVAPKNAEYRRKLAVYLASQDRVDDAIAALDAAGADSNSPILMTSRLEILASAGRYTAAEAAVNVAIKDHPTDANWYAILANALYNQSKFDAAIASAEKALAIDPRNNRALITRAMSKLNRPGGDLSEAIKDLEAYRDLNPQDNNVRRLLADAYMRRQRPDDATRELEIALHNSPEDRQVRSTLLEYYRTTQRWSDGDQIVKDAQSIDKLMKDPEWLSAESTWMVVRHQWPQALEKIRSAMYYAPKDPRYVQLFMSVLLSTQNESTLLRETEPMIAADPGRWWIYQARGLARKAMKNDAMAETEFSKAVNTALALKDPDAVETTISTMRQQVSPDKALQLIEPHAAENLRYLISTASLYLQMGNDDACLKNVANLMNQVDAASPDIQARILTFCGAAYSAVKPQQTDNAIKAYERLVKLQPDNPEALNQLAWLLATGIKPERPQDALQYSTRAYNLISGANRFSPTIFDTQGWVLYLCGKVDDAVLILRQVVEQTPANIDARYHLGMAYKKQDKRDEAAAQFSAAKQLIDTAESAKAPVDAELKKAVLTAIEQLSSLKP